MGKRDWSWAILGVFALLIRFVAAQYPEATDDIYSRMFFPVIRNVIDMTLGKLPFPSVYLFIASVVLVIGVYINRLRKRKGWKYKIFYSFRALSNGLGALIFFFLFFWGFNYQRTSIVQQLGLVPKALNLEQVKNEINITQRLVQQYRRALKLDTAAIQETIPYPELEIMVRRNIADNLDMLGLNFTGRPRTKLFSPPGFMRKMGILGIYFPFTGESYIDPTLHALEKPFTVAHEMAHSYGVTDEGEANFIAWVICTNSDDPLMGYSGQLKLLAYQIRDYYKMDPKAYKKWIITLDSGVRNDLISIQKAGEEIKPYSIELSRRTNDIFLKSQGVKAGIMSYQQLPKLAFAWRERMKWE
jgi:hypothetical protein